MRHRYGTVVWLRLPSPSPRIGCECLHGQRDVLRDTRQEAALVPRDRVAGHSQFLRQFGLSETEAEPLFTKLPAGQLRRMLPTGACAVNHVGIVYPMRDSGRRTSLPR